VDDVQELVTLAKGLRDEDRKELVRVARSLASGGAREAAGPASRSWDEIATSFPKDAAEEMARIIEEEFEQIDPEDWK
jgi:hypothetical protein